MASILQSPSRTQNICRLTRSSWSRCTYHQEMSASAKNKLLPFPTVSICIRNACQVDVTLFSYEFNSHTRICIMFQVES